MVITDKVQTQNVTDFTFVCSKVPFAVSCSSDLPHRNFNAIDLDLVNKMKIPLKNIRVTRINIQGHDLRCVGVVSQTVQCVLGGKISGTIHLYAKVVRDLYNSISVDCLASRRTYARLMECDPEDEPPDFPSVIEVLGGDGDADEDTDHVRVSDVEGGNVPAADVEGGNVPAADVEEVNVPAGDDEGGNVPAAKEGEVPTSNAEGDDVSSTTEEVPIDYDKCYTSPPLHPEDSDVCYDSDGNYDELLTRFVNGEFPEYDYYQAGALHKISRTKSPLKSGGRSSTIQSSRQEKHCQYCFLNGEPIQVTHSHNIMDIDCPSMTDDDRRRIHGDKETDKWLARLYGYHD